MAKAFILNQLVDELGMSISGFEKHLGLSNGRISKAIERKSAITTPLIETIVSKFPNVSKDWLLTGQGDMIIKPKGEKDEPPSNLPIKKEEPKRNILRGHTKEEHLAMAAALSSGVHEGEAVEKWIKANHEITKFAPDVMGMTFQNLNHHLRKEKLSDSFRGLFEMKTGMSIERDILGGAPTDLEEKLRTWNINALFKEIYEEIEKLKRNNK